MEPSPVRLALEVVPPPPALLQCARTSLVVNDTRTGRRFAAYCGSQKCPACLEHKALDYARALARAKPDWQVRLTLVGKHWPQIAARMKRFHRKIRDLLGPDSAFEHAYAVEPNPKKTGNHIHGWAHGTHLDASALEDAALAAGMGSQVWEGPVNIFRGVADDPMIKYPFKSVLGHTWDATELSPSAQQHLELNNGRLISTTARFWRDGETGELYGRVREAVRGARRAAGRSGRFEIAGMKQEAER